MKYKLILATILLSFACVATSLGQSTPNAPKQGTVSDSERAAIQQKLEPYLRNVYAWGPAVKLSFTDFAAAPMEGIYKVTVTVSTGEQSDSAAFYVSKDGHYMMRGEVEDLTSDPLAEVRKQINLDNSPSKGPADAKVVMVEYADFECPSCRAAEPGIRSIEAKYPQVRVVFKDFPLTQIHPWAMTAALAGRCTYQMNPAAFWKFHDTVYDNQDLISAANAYDKLQDYATQAGITDTSALRTCMADPKTAQSVADSQAEGQRLHVANTPTIYINGRKLIGGDPAALNQFIQFDLPSSPNPKLT